MQRPSARWVPVIIVLVFLAGYLLLLDDGLMVDEIPHYEQAASFASGEWSVNPDLTVVPGYHFVLASLSLATGWSSVAAFRLFTLVFSFLAAMAFFLIARELSENPGWRTSQFLFLPLLFPFFFLLYTDVLSLAFVLLMVLFALRKRYALSCLFGLLSCLVRQNDIVWVAFVFLLVYVQDHGWRWRPVRESLRRYWPYVLVGVLFVGYVLVNGDVSFGDTYAHPSFSFHLTNVWFFLFLSCFLFLPSLYAQRKGILSFFRDRRSLLLGAALFALFAFTFINNHPYNIDWGEYFLRNRLLIFFSSAWWWKLVFFVPVAFAVAFFSAVPVRKRWWLLYPFTFLFLVPSWLVEQRYYIIPLSLFLLAKEEDRKSVEWVQLAWFVLWSVALFLVVDAGRLFL